MMRHERDYQRTRLYRAEWEIIEDFDTLSLDFCWDFLTSLIKSDWFAANFPKTFVYLGGDRWGTGRVDPEEYRPNNRLVYLHHGDRRRGLKLRPGYRRKHAETCHATITLPVWSRNKLTLLHELAHLCCWCDLENGETLSFHGKEFSKVYLTLVERVLGKEIRKQLEGAMLNNKVKIAPSYRPAVQQKPPTR